MIVNTKVSYSSNILNNNINSLLKKFPFLQKEVIGYSVLGKPIYSLKIGTGKKEIFISGAFHANEWIVSPVLMKFLEELCITFSTNSTIYGYSTSYLLNNVTYYICPMVNPDGVDLVTGAMNQISNPYSYAKIISADFPEIPFPSRMESKFKWCGSKLTISSWLDKCKRNKICSRF